MGVGSAAVWCVSAPDPIAVLRGGVTSDRDAAAAVARSVHPGLEPELVGMAPLTAFAVSAEPHRLLVGCYQGITVVCASDPAVVRPSTVDSSWLNLTSADRTYLIASERDHAWGAFAQWDHGTLRRSFSASPAYIHEDEGLPQPWERPFWSGEHPLQFDGDYPDPQALPFHPQEFADAAGAQWLGVRMIGGAQDGDIDPTTVLLCDFRMVDPSAVRHSPPPPSDEAAPSPTPPAKKRGLFRRLVS